MPADLSPARLEAAREALPALAHGVYLNTGTAGPLPEAAADALQDAFAQEVARGRIGHAAFEAASAARDAVRGELAAVLQVPPEQLALMHHSTDGLNAAALGLRWRRGDVVVTTDLEHAAVQLVLGALRLREGVEVRTAQLRTARDRTEATERFEAQLQGPVRAVFCSHVSYATGQVLPLATLAALAHAAGAAVVVDGAQSVGAMAVRPADLGADFYTISGQKWLCGPEGTGALWVRPGWEERLAPAALGYFGIRQLDAEGYYLPHPGARRLEVGTTFGPGLLGLAASLRWLGGIGWDAIWARTLSLADRLRRGLAGLDGVEVLTPAPDGRSAGAAGAGLVSFTLAASEAEVAVTALGAAGFVVRSIPGHNAIRASTGFFLREAEIDALVGAVAELAEHPPVAR